MLQNVAKNGGKTKRKKQWLFLTGRRGKALFPKNTREEKVYLLTIEICLELDVGLKVSCLGAMNV
jgi:hypothetical protein